MGCVKLRDGIFTTSEEEWATLNKESVLQKSKMEKKNHFNRDWGNFKKFNPNFTEKFEKC